MAAKRKLDELESLSENPSGGRRSHPHIHNPLPSDASSLADSPRRLALENGAPLTNRTLAPVTDTLMTFSPYILAQPSSYQIPVHASRAIVSSEPEDSWSSAHAAPRNTPLLSERTGDLRGHNSSIIGKRQSLTFRVRGIPSDLVDEFAAYIKNVAEPDTVKLSFAPPLSDLDTDYIATTSFEKAVPGIFDTCTSAYPDSRIEFPLSRKVELFVDMHFHTLTPLNSPASSPQVDLVAVTGLGGHAFGSWKAPGTQEMWLRDYLVTDLKNKDMPARVMIYGYKSNLEGSVSNSHIHDYAMNLLEELKVARDADTTKQRPLFFIGHSLGGLVIKHALKEAAQGDSDSKTLFKSCSSLMFFGVPNRGLAIENFRSMVEGQPNEQLIIDLGPQAALLRALHNEFARQFTLFDGSRVVSAFETEESPTVIQKDGTWSRSGPSRLMVPRESAINSAPNERIHDQLSIQSNHSDMVKFRHRGDSNYVVVRGKVLNMMQEAVEVVSKRFGQNSIERSHASDPQESDGMMVMPFRRNEDFVGRQDILDRLQKMLEPHDDGHQPRVALWGLGGTGKTDLAVEFCYRVLACWKGTSIFWVHGRSDESFASSFQHIFKTAGLVVADQKGESVLAAVKQWLEESNKSRRWLLIIDNLDDIHISSTKYVPSRNGSILFTTRDRRILGNHTPARAGLEVPCMTSDEASQLFLSHSGKNSIEISHLNDESSVTVRGDLCRRLDYLPLAIRQAAAYIQHTETSVAEYVRMLQSSETQQAKILSKAYTANNPGFEESDRASAATMTTWDITLARLEVEEGGPAAITLLRIISFLDPDEIPLTLLRNSPPTELEDDLDFREAVGLLLSLALVSKLQNRGVQQYRVHRLVSLWTRYRIPHTIVNQILLASLRMMANGLPDYSFGDPFEVHQNAMQLLPHATSVVEQARKRNSYNFSYLSLNLKVSHRLSIAGRYHAVMHHAQLCVSACKYCLSQPDPLFYMIDHTLGSCFGQNGEYDEALEWYQRALAGYEKALGKEHPDTLTTVDNMASVFLRQGRDDEALEWYQRALAGREKALGKEHPNTLSTVHGMAYVFHKQGRYDEALEWYQRALAGREKALGKEHPKTLTTVHTMAYVFHKQGRHDEALEWYQQALAGSEKALGKEHPDTLSTVHAMASVFHWQGRHDEALEWYQRALAGREKALGDKHPFTQSTIRNYIWVCENIGQLDNAAELRRRLC